ncbi:MAG: class II aldolase/adducin family protein [Legionellaceae bacterium]|nr:class II aldolase/adducin family protein [Legionellaceae bacterium]
MNCTSLKQQLTQAYHTLAYLGLDDHTYTHLSVRASTQDAFYIYPFGLRFEETQADTLMKISLQGDILEGEEYQYNRTGYVIHSSLYTARPDIQALFHIHTPEIVAVSAMEAGLLPISQWALHFYNQVAYHGYHSLTLDWDAGKALIQDFQQGYTLLLRNHGAILGGRTIQEAMFYTYHLQMACKTQCMALAMQQPLVTPSADICEQAVADLLSFEAQLGARDWEAWGRLLKRQNRLIQEKERV